MKRSVEVAGIQMSSLPEVNPDPFHLPEDHYLNTWENFARHSPLYAEEATRLNKKMLSLRNNLAGAYGNRRPTRNFVSPVNLLHRAIGPGELKHNLADSLMLYDLVTGSPEMINSPEVSNILAGNMLFDAALDGSIDDVGQSVGLLELASQHYAATYELAHNRRMNRYRQLGERLDISARLMNVFLQARSGAFSEDTDLKKKFMHAHKQHIGGFIELCRQELKRKTPDYGFIAEWYGEIIFRDQMWWTDSIDSASIRTAFWREDEPIAGHEAGMPRINYDFQVYSDNGSELVTRSKQLKIKKMKPEGKHLRSRYADYHDSVDVIRLYYEDAEEMTKGMVEDAKNIIAEYGIKSPNSTRATPTYVGSLAMELAA